MPCDYPEGTGGRCHHCNVRYVWKGAPRLKNAYCRWCGGKLRQTTHLFKGRTVEQKPITQAEAERVKSKSGIRE